MTYDWQTRRYREKFNYLYYFRIMPAGPHPRTDWSIGFFETARQQNPPAKTVALISADAEFVRNAASGEWENAKKYGLQIVYDRTYPPDTADFSPIVRAIKAVNPDIVFVPSCPPASVHDHELELCRRCLLVLRHPATEQP